MTKSDSGQTKEEKVKADESQSSGSSATDFNYKDFELTISEMLKRGVHFGHRKSRWNPKMRPYIFGVRNNVHIIDLGKTVSLFEKALEFIRSIVFNNGKILFIGTKPQAKKLIAEAAKETDMPYVNNRWLGGTFTNFKEISGRIKYLNDQERKEKAGEFKKYTKYEQIKIKKEIDKMNEKMGGIKKMDKLPQAIFAVDVIGDKLAVKEARQVKIPVIALTDTNTDPTLADYPIPANDDAISSLEFMLGIVVKNIKGVGSQAERDKRASSKM